MRKVELSYTFGAERQDTWVRNALMDLLHAVQEQGSISGAARELGLSYRHVWGELRRWEAKLGLPLRECSCLRHDRVLKWMGMRPLIRIDRTELYHGGCSLSRSHRGVGPALAALRPWSVWPAC